MPSSRSAAITAPRNAECIDAGLCAVWRELRLPHARSRCAQSVQPEFWHYKARAERGSGPDATTPPRQALPSRPCRTDRDRPCCQFVGISAPYRNALGRGLPLAAGVSVLPGVSPPIPGPHSPPGEARTYVISIPIHSRSWYLPLSYTSPDAVCARLCSAAPVRLPLPLC
jgi:hypothetical protein